MECAIPLQTVPPLVDAYAAFWLFLLVGLTCSSFKLALSDGRRQNRYFPMSYQVWLFASQSFISPPGPWKGADNLRPNHSGLYPTLQHGSVRITVVTGWISSTYSRPHKNSCNQTAFYPILAFVICTLLAQVVLTIRSGTLVMVQLI